jgi:1,4-dihydroxy-2-naphthoate octaprenyltransferase
MRWRDVPVVFRAREWWEFKLGPVLAVIYGTAFQSGTSLFDHGRSLLEIVIALAAVGAFANVLNDWTDLEEDAAVGKQNRLAGRSRWLPLFLLIATGLLGCGAVILLRPGMTGSLFYFGIAAAFSLYSVSPIRLKRRGLPGVLADAAGAHAFPALFVMFAFANAAAIKLSLPWVMSVSLWASASGIRGILWHQLRDYENDKRSGGFTFVCRRGPESVRKTGERVVFPLELIALCSLLIVCGSAIPFIVLVLDMLLTQWRKMYREIASTVVQPRAHARIRMLEFNDTLLPVALLLASALRHPADLFVLAVHVVIFPVRLRIWLRDFVRLGVKTMRKSGKGSRSHEKRDD